jgi:hypothetical protein
VYNNQVNYDKEIIKTFVKQILGCACPEEVFEYIDCKSNIQLNDIVLSNKINIGNRLLIYLIEIINPGPIKNILPLLLSAGIKERDGLGFNRFRLVLVSDKVDEIKEVAESLFKTTNKDEKVHLHVISKDKVPIFSKIKHK